MPFDRGSLFWRAAVALIIAEAATAWVIYLATDGGPGQGLVFPVSMTAGAVIVRVGLRGAYGARS